MAAFCPTFSSVRRSTFEGGRTASPPASQPKERGKTMSVFTSPSTHIPHPPSAPPHPPQLAHPPLAFSAICPSTKRTQFLPNPLNPLPHLCLNTASSPPSASSPAPPLSKLQNEPNPPPLICVHLCASVLQNEPNFPIPSLPATFSQSNQGGQRGVSGRPAGRKRGTSAGLSGCLRGSAGRANPTRHAILSPSITGAIQ